MHVCAARVAAASPPSSLLVASCMLLQSPPSCIMSTPICTFVFDLDKNKNCMYPATSAVRAFAMALRARGHGLGPPAAWRWRRRGVCWSSDAKVNARAVRRMRHRLQGTPSTSRHTLPDGAAEASAPLDAALRGAGPCTSGCCYGEHAVDVDCEVERSVWRYRIKASTAAAVGHWLAHGVRPNPRKGPAVDWPKGAPPAAAHTGVRALCGGAAVGPNGGGGGNGAVGRDARLAARDHAGHRADGRHAPPPSAQRGGGRSGGRRCGRGARRRRRPAAGQAGGDGLHGPAQAPVAIDARPPGQHRLRAGRLARPGGRACTTARRGGRRARGHARRRGRAAARAGARDGAAAVASVVAHHPRRGVARRAGAAGLDVLAVRRVGLGQRAAGR